MMLPGTYRGISVAEPPEVTHLRRRLSSTNKKHLESELHRAGSVKHTLRESLNNPYFFQGSNNENELQYLVHFIHLEFLEMYYYITKFIVQNIKQRNKNNTSIDNKQGSICAHQKNPLHNDYSLSSTCNRGK